MAISVLEAWGALLADVVTVFKELKDTRNSAIHFNPETDVNDRDLALLAIGQLSRVIQGQFAALGNHPWFISGAKGAAFIRKDHQEVPFVKEIILPNCVLVGPFHTLDQKNDQWHVRDNYEYPDRDVSDEEFVAMANDRKL